jgi:Protein of unknown function (DUF3040)
MEVLAMGLHATERWKLLQIEESLRASDPGLDALLAGRPPLRRPGLQATAAWLLAGYIGPPALIIAGLILHVTWLAAAGVAACPVIPVTAWLLIRRHFIRGWIRHNRER